MWRAAALAAAPLLPTAGAVAPPSLPNGTVDAVYDLLDRVLPGQRSSFSFSFTDSCPGAAPPCYHVSATGGNVAVAATGANELSAGLGYYLREHCNMTIGWPRGGGSNIFVPSSGWPSASVSRRRVVPWSYAMNVCTHSYSFVWYSWEDWEKFLDWMALSGINNFLAMTGQEEVQYKVYKHFGLEDQEIRGWFNGPALLTWSRGQNEYGSAIAGPLPRSWMKAQWDMQRKILPRARSLGMVGQLPGFQGNAPVRLKTIKKDSNMTDNKKGTAWIDALDPVFGEIADYWMQTMIADFGTDHWYQLDGYFNGATAPWLAGTEQGTASAHGAAWPSPDPTWLARGKAAYGGLSRTDPDAVWSFQSWAVNGWSSQAQAAGLRGFVEAAPKGKFQVIDMSYDGRGHWKLWDDAAFFDAPFVWTSLHDFGGTDTLRGSLARANEIPFAALEAGKEVWGTGFTPEGIDQNPAFYEFLIEQNWRAARVPDVAARIVDRSHRRYGLAAANAEVTAAWRLLAESSYSLDQWGQDTGGVGHLPGTNYNNYAWKGDSAMPPAPTPAMCKVWGAWGHLLAAAPAVDAALEPFRYDLVNTGREVLSQLALPLSIDFAHAYGETRLDAAKLRSSAQVYMDLLGDLDELVDTDTAFQVSGWIEQARGLAGGAADCEAKGYPVIADCAHFLEWNARSQITTWDPTPEGAKKPGKDTVDYAPKHWSGLIRDYYKARVGVVLEQALSDASAGRKLDAAAVDRAKARLAYNWTTATKKYPTTPVGDAVAVSRRIHESYKGYFTSCGVSPPPGTPPPPPPPPTPPPSPSAAGVYLYEDGGAGQLFLPRASFAANAHRGSTLAWDVCGGGSFDNGSPLWTSGVGSFVGAFRVSGGWSLRTSPKCGLHYEYDPLPLSSTSYTSADGKVAFKDGGYFEEA